MQRRLTTEEQRQLLQMAIDASGLSARRFAVEVLGVNERTLRRWIAGDQPLPGPARGLCQALLARQ